MYVKWRDIVPGDCQVETRLAASPRCATLRAWARGPVAPSLDRGTLRFSRGGLMGGVPEPVLELPQGKLTLQSMTFFAVAHLAVERRQQVECDIRRLKVLALRLRDVVDQRTERRRSRRGRRFAARGQHSRIHSRHQAGRD